jgi:hypothetical protein
MEQSKELIKKFNITPFLKLAIKLEGGGVEGTGPHHVKLLEDKIVKGTDFKGNERFEVQYLVEENGEKKKYRVAMKDENGELHYLVQRLAEFKEGNDIIMEYKRQGKRGYIDVRGIKEGIITEDKEELPIISYDDIPVVEDEPKVVRKIPIKEGGEKTIEEDEDGEISPEDLPF